MKEEYHARFVAILQIIYQWERLTYFGNPFAITLNLAKQKEDQLMFHSVDTNVNRTNLVDGTLLTIIHGLFDWVF